MSMTIRTNGVPRNTVGTYELTDKELKMIGDDFNLQEDVFFRFKGDIYAFSEFMRTDSFPGWDAFHGESAFSGVVIKLVDNGDKVVVGRYFS